MTNEELTSIEARGRHSAYIRSLVEEVRLAWAELDKAAQRHVDAEKREQTLRAALWQVRELDYPAGEMKAIAAKALEENGKPGGLSPMRTGVHRHA